MASGCGSETQCGLGTVEVDGTCVPAEDACAGGSVFDPETGQCEGVVCADGTSLEGDECVPDGTVICGDGTSYDPDTGTCEPDINECAEGTVLVDGNCVPYDDSLVADVEEMPEPNDVPDANAGEFEVPAIGEDAVTIHGCIEPADFDGDGALDPDFDAYYFLVDEPTLLDVTVDGLGGLSGGFVALTGDEQLASSGWVRFGVTLTGDVAQRQVYLPKAGVYALQISDGRSLFLGEPAGGPDQCYFASVSSVAIPAPTPIAGGVVEGDLGNDVQFFSYDPAEGDFLFSAASVDSNSASVGLVQELNSAYVSSSGYGDPAELVLGGLTDTDEVVFVVDPEVNFALAPVPFRLAVDAPVVGEAPEDATVSVTHDEGFYTWFYFDAEAGDVVHTVADVDAGSPFELHIGDANGFLVGTLCSGCTAVDEWVHFAEAGRYYLVLYNLDGVGGETYELTLSRPAVTPTPLALDTVESDALSAELTNWYTADLSAALWIAIQGGTTNFTGDLAFAWYDPSQTGIVGDSLLPLYDGTLTGTDDEIGRVVADSATPMVLVSVTDDGTPAAGSTFDFGIVNRMFTDLGTVDAGNEPDVTGETLAAAAVNRYFLRSTPGATVSLTVTPAGVTENLVLRQVGAEEQVVDVADSGIAGEPETLEAFVGADGWVAVEVTESLGGEAGYDLAVSYAEPVSYTSAASGLGFTSVCPADGGAGVDHVLVDDGSGFGAGDEGVSLTPVDLSGLGFELYGNELTEVTVSSNGWVTGDLGYAGSAGVGAPPMPSESSPNSVLAPFGADLDLVSVCVLDSGDAVTIQWDGADYSAETTVQFQLVLNADDTVDMIYGPSHVDAATTIGVESALGILAMLVADGQLGFSAPDTSWTLTPSM